MRKYLLLSTFAFALAVGPAAYAADEATCQQLFDKADTDKNATISGTEVTPFAAIRRSPRQMLT